VKRIIPKARNKKVRLEQLKAVHDRKQR
jgi:hypothetical protein